jgi:deoxyribodipyrimidine photo-lyase
MTTLVWFRQDLRLADNPALAAAQAAGGPVIPVYVHAPAAEAAWAPGGASRWWLHHSLASLDADLAGAGSRLIVRAGDDCLDELRALARASGAQRIVWNRRYEPHAILRDREIKSALRADGLAVESYNSALLREPWEVETQNGDAFQVFTPFWRRCLALGDPPAPQPAPHRLPAPPTWPRALALEELNLLPRIAWAGGLAAAWTPGRAGALEQLARFLEDGFADYTAKRNRPDLAGTSRLSPHLHYGEIGPREIWQATRQCALARGLGETWRQSQFASELGWREFAYHLLFHFPHTPETPLRAKYAAFPWRTNPGALVAWQRGLTGYPIVDAGMRELWQTGWMHNRVRMIVASFLVKDLLLSWQEGARWFWDTLVDADLASNTLGWQWAAGCGADAAPYFRIFNPMLQGAKFDPDGDYVRRWVPELARLPPDVIHAPWNATKDVLGESEVRLGANYPNRLVEHESARRAALEALASLSGS